MDPNTQPAEQEPEKPTWADDNTELWSDRNHETWGGDQSANTEAEK